MKKEALRQHRIAAAQQAKPVWYKKTMTTSMVKNQVR